MFQIFLLSASWTYWKIFKTKIIITEISFLYFLRFKILIIYSSRKFVNILAQKRNANSIQFYPFVAE